MKSNDEKMIPVTFMLDKERHNTLKTASKSTRVSMSELVRLSVDNLMSVLGDPKKPNMEELGRLFYLSDQSNDSERVANDTSKK